MMSGQRHGQLESGGRFRQDRSRPTLYHEIHRAIGTSTDAAPDHREVGGRAAGLTRRRCCDSIRAQPAPVPRRRPRWPPTATPALEVFAMTDRTEYRTPFVLGYPIKNPPDFYGRERVLRALFDAALKTELVAVVGEHRCGNTSVLYQLLHEAQRARYLTPGEDARLLFAFVSCQLATEGPEAFYRRIALALRRVDPEIELDPTAAVTQVWLENYLESLARRRRTPVLLLDEFEVIAKFDPAFWEWFQVLVTEYDVSIIASTRADLSEYRAEHGGPAFFNLFRSIFLGSFTPETVETFLRDKTELADFDYFAVRDVLQSLAGRFPFYMQVAASLFYFHAAGENHVTPEQTEAVIRDFKARTWMLFEDAWHKLPQIEREALVWMAEGGRHGGEAEMRFAKALGSLERRGYVFDGHIFSTAFTEYVLEHAAGA